jgi:hypothetical protein
LEQKDLQGDYMANKPRLPKQKKQAYSSLSPVDSLVILHKENSAKKRLTTAASVACTLSNTIVSFYPNLRATLIVASSSLRLLGVHLCKIKDCEQTVFQVLEYQEGKLKVGSCCLHQIRSVPIASAVVKILSSQCLPMENKFRHDSV